MADESKHRDKGSIDKDLGTEGDIGSRANEGSDSGYQGNKSDRNYDKGNMDRNKDMARNPSDMKKDMDRKNTTYGNDKGNADYRK